MTVVSYTTPITLITRTKTGVDGYNDDAYSETSTVVDGVFAPGGSSEVVQGGDTVTTQPTVYLPDMPVTAVDAVTVNGQTYEVDGDVQTWPVHPMTGWRPEFPVVVPLKRVTG